MVNGRISVSNAVGTCLKSVNVLAVDFALIVVSVPYLVRQEDSAPSMLIARKAIS